MGYSIFSIGETVRIIRGNFAGIEGTIIDPVTAHEAGGTVILRQGATMLLPVAVAASVDGRSLILRVPPDILERVPAINAAPQ